MTNLHKNSKVITQVRSSHPERPHGRDDEDTSKGEGRDGEELELGVGEDGSFGLVGKSELIKAGKFEVCLS